MKIVVSHPTGNQNVRAIATGFSEAGIADSFYTTIATFPGDWASRLADHKMFSILGRRAFDPGIKSITRTWPWLELSRLFSLKAGFYHLTKHERGIFCIDAVYRNFDKHIASILKKRADQGATALYAYEDGALCGFRRAKEIGFQCFYDLPIGYWRAGRRILEAEKERWPEWIPTLTGLHDSDQKLLRKDEEIRLADRIYVASRFTAKTLQDFPGSLPSVEVIPYGFPPVVKHREYSVNGENAPLKILFVGGLTQRKGIADLFAVAEKLNRYVKLTVVGKRTINSCAALDKELAKHKWIESMPNSEILKLMRQHDALVFPSVFEGFGLVITEAMSQGTPVITTEHTAGPDLIEHDHNGWIVKAGSTVSLQFAIEDLLSNRKAIAQCGRAAMETARSRPWHVYATEMAKSIQKKMMMELH